MLGSKGGLMVQGTVWAVAASIWAVTLSMSDVSSSMHDAQVLCELLHSTYELSHAPCGLLQPLCMM